MQDSRLTPDPNAASTVVTNTGNTIGGVSSSTNDHESDKTSSTRRRRSDLDEVARQLECLLIKCFQALALGRYDVLDAYLHLPPPVDNDNQATRETDKKRAETDTGDARVATDIDNAKQLLRPLMLGQRSSWQEQTQDRIIEGFLSLAIEARCEALVMGTVQYMDREFLNVRDTSWDYYLMRAMELEDAGSLGWMLFNPRTTLFPQTRFLDNALEQKRPVLSSQLRQRLRDDARWFTPKETLVLALYYGANDCIREMLTRHFDDQKATIDDLPTFLTFLALGVRFNHVEVVHFCLRTPSVALSLFLINNDKEQYLALGIQNESTQVLCVLLDQYRWLPSNDTLSRLIGMDLMRPSLETSLDVVLFHEMVDQAFVLQAALRQQNDRVFRAVIESGRTPVDKVDLFATWKQMTAMPSALLNVLLNTPGPFGSIRPFSASTVTGGSCSVVLHMTTWLTQADNDRAGHYVEKLAMALQSRSLFVAAFEAFLSLGTELRWACAVELSPVGFVKWFSSVYWSLPFSSASPLSPSSVSSSSSFQKTVVHTNPLFSLECCASALTFEGTDKPMNKYAEAMHPYAKMVVETLLDQTTDLPEALIYSRVLRDHILTFPFD
jgi:hypothetical protein